MNARFIFLCCLFSMLLACRSDKPIIASAVGLQALQLNYAPIHLRDTVQMEKNLGSVQLSSKQEVYVIHRTLYSNYKHHRLSNGLAYARTAESFFESRVEYYYDLRDSSIKAELYEWNPVPDQTAYSQQEQNSIFKQKFEQIKAGIISDIGSPTNQSIESDSLPTHYRDVMRWSTDSIKAALYAFGGDDVKHQLRVVISWD